MKDDVMRSLSDSPDPSDFVLAWDRHKSHHQQAGSVIHGVYVIFFIMVPQRCHKIFLTRVQNIHQNRVLVKQNIDPSIPKKLKILKRSKFKKKIRKEEMRI